MKILSKTEVLLPRFILVSFLRQLVFCSDHRKKVPTDTLGALGSVFARVSSSLPSFPPRSFSSNGISCVLLFKSESPSGMALNLHSDFR